MLLGMKWEISVIPTELWNLYFTIFSPILYFPILFWNNFYVCFLTLMIYFNFLAIFNCLLFRFPQNNLYPILSFIYASCYVFHFGSCHHSICVKYNYTFFYVGNKSFDLSYICVKFLSSQIVKIQCNYKILDF